MDAPDLREIFGAFFAWKAQEDTWFISFMNGSQFLYLLEGSEKALLIDTGYAVGGLREFVERLTDKPVLVVNTHYHPDHAGGNGEWERVMMSRGAALDRHAMERTAGDPAALPHPDYEKVYVGEGDRIELGGRTVEVLEARDCHSHSGLYLLDRSRRMLFMGDEMDAGQVLIYDNSNDPALAGTYSLNESLHHYLENLRRAQALDGEYDWLLGGHNGAPLAKSYLSDFIGLVEHIYAGDAVVEEKLNHKFIEMDPVAPRLCRVRWRKASIFTYRDQLREIWGRAELL